MIVIVYRIQIVAISLFRYYSPEPDLNYHVQMYKYQIQAKVGFLHTVFFVSPHESQNEGFSDFFLRVRLNSTF